MAKNVNIVQECNSEDNNFTRHTGVKNNLIDTQWMAVNLDGVQHQGQYSEVIVMMWEFKEESGGC